MTVVTFCNLCGFWFFFFKQKTAYEMRISDWSSDVCSSDLNAALLSGYDKELDFVVAGIPVVDLAQALWSFAPPGHRAYYAEHGLTEALYRNILKPVSPLTRAPLLDRDRLFIVGASADRIVVPDHPLQLARHWAWPTGRDSGRERGGQE